MVDRYDLDGNSAWVLVVPDEKGRTATYKLTTGTSTVRVFRPTIGADAMTEEVLNTTNGTIELTVTETPLFVLPGENKTASLADAGAIAGPATVCVNTPAEYSVTPVTGATGYDWKVPAGWQIQSGTNSNTISVRPSPVVRRVISILSKNRLAPKTSCQSSSGNSREIRSLSSAELTKK